MALSSFVYLTLGFIASFSTCDQILDWNVTWLTTNPDGQMERPTMGINGQWPLPLVNVTKGERLIVNVENQLGNQSTSFHFHGLYQYNTTHMDGVAGGTQCDIPPGGSFTYNFTADQNGTYWYHSHVRGQYPDGLRGPMIITDPDYPYQYDEEIVMTLSDWYHDQMPGLIKNFISVSNPTGAEPVPDAALMNDGQNVTFDVEPGKTYLFRIVNMGAFAGQYLWFENHTMSVVEVDGIYTEPADTDMIYITAAQRYSVLVKTKNDTSSNFAIVGSMDTDLFDTIPPTLNYNVTGWLVYDNAKANPDPALVDEFDPFDDFTLVPYDHQELFDTVDQSITLDMKMDNLGDGANYAFFNDQTYVGPKVPSLYTVMSTGSAATDPAIYGVNSQPFILGYNQTVEIILNNRDTGKHPFHLHGHDFQAVVRSAELANDYVNNETMPQYPMRRDVLMVRPNGNFVIRFKSDNPGLWLFHCHIEWHVDSGLIATMIEAPLQMQEWIQIPESHYETCRAADIPYQGNAAGNTVNLYDLQGANVSPAPLPSGFTARGIVALVFSVISAFLGMAFIVWYGMKPINAADNAAAKRVVQLAGENDTS